MCFIIYSLKKKRVEYAVADIIKTTSSIIAIICIVAFISYFIINDTFNLGIYLFGRQTKNQLKNKAFDDLKKANNENKIKPVYLVTGGTKC